MSRIPRDSFGGFRRRLIETLRSKGIDNMAVLAAFAEVPRHEFVPNVWQHRAYDDASLPIGNGQTISQPFIHARYLEAAQLTGSEFVLEVGTGSGFQTALLSRLVDRVLSLERVPELANSARQRLRAFGYSNVSVRLADGTVGWKPEAPYDVILVTAAGPCIPEPLYQQMAEGGRLLMPVTQGDGQVLIRVVRRGDEFIQETLHDVRFVPLIGEHGYEPS